ncbi:MAG: hypothetical protein RR961_11015 [Eubacterium sp.]
MKEEESSPTVSGLEEKIKKRQQMLALGVNSPDLTFEDYLYQFLITVHFLKLKPRSKERYLCTFNKKLKGQTGPIKCNEIRLNKLPVVLVNILKEHKIRQKCELAEYGMIQTDESFVFSTCIGTHLDASNVYKKLKQVYLDLGITEEGSAYNKIFHDLQRTYVKPTTKYFFKKKGLWIGQCLPKALWLIFIINIRSN